MEANEREGNKERKKVRQKGKNRKWKKYRGKSKEKKRCSKR